MIRLAALFLFIAGGASAQSFDEGGWYAPPSEVEVPRFVGNGEYTHPSINNNATGDYVVRVTPGDGHWADVFYQNRLVRAIEVPNLYDFAFDGLVISVIIDSGDGDSPETITVIPPDGFYAIPPEAVVDEDESIVIEIHENLFM